MNPISRLAQIQQAKKEKEPEYALLSERGMPRRREFIMQVNSHTFFFRPPFKKNKKALPQGGFTSCGSSEAFPAATTVTWGSEGK